MTDCQQFSQLSLEDDHREDCYNLPRSVLDRATTAKLTLESNYRAALQQAIDRNQRYFFFKKNTICRWFKTNTTSTVIELQV